MAEETNDRCVSGQSAVVLSHLSHSFLNRIGQFSRAVVPVHSLAECVAAFQILRRRLADGVTDWDFVNCPALHHNERLTNIEAKFGIQRHRAAVKRGLYQTYACEILFCRAIHYGLHELASGARVLCRRINSDGTYAGDGRALVEAIAADNPPVLFRHYAVEARM